MYMVIYILSTEKISKWVTGHVTSEGLYKPGEEWVMKSTSLQLLKLII